MRKNKLDNIKFFPASGYDFIFRNKIDKEICYLYINNPDYTYLDIGNRFGLSATRVRQKVCYYNNKFKLYFLEPNIYKAFYINNPNKK